MTTTAPAKSPPVQNPYEYDEEFWKDRFPAEPYVKEGDSFDDYAPAYRFGVSMRTKYRDFDSNEETLREHWENHRGSSRLDWDRAREPVKIAWFQDPQFATTLPEEVL